MDSCYCRDNLYIEEKDASQVRLILHEHTRLESLEQGAGDTELMKFCCVQLFSLGCKEDILLIWAAKSSSFDADCSIDIKLLCGMGLEATIRLLQTQGEAKAQSALNRIFDYQSLGFFEGFSVQEYMLSCIEYYSE